jgi:hypothetical protein
MLISRQAERDEEEEEQEASRPASKDTLHTAASLVAPQLAPGASYLEDDDACY